MKFINRLKTILFTKSIANIFVILAVPICILIGALVLKYRHRSLQSDLAKLVESEKSLVQINKLNNDKSKISINKFTDFFTNYESILRINTEIFNKMNGCIGQLNEEQVNTCLNYQIEINQKNLDLQSLKNKNIEIINELNTLK